MELSDIIIQLDESKETIRQEVERIEGLQSCLEDYVRSLSDLCDSIQERIYHIKEIM